MRDLNLFFFGEVLFLNIELIFGFNSFIKAAKSRKRGEYLCSLTKLHPRMAKCKVIISVMLRTASIICGSVFQSYKLFHRNSFSSTMPAYEGVPFSGHGSIKVVQAFKDRICPVFPADFKHSPLKLTLSFECVTVRKQVILQGVVIRLNIFCTYAKAANKQRMIDFVIEGLHNSLTDSTYGIGTCPKTNCPIAVLRMKPAIKVQRNGTAIHRMDFETFVVIGYPPGQ